MRRLSLEELSRRADAFDEAVQATGEIDQFCSSTDWILPAARALMPEREPWIYESQGSFWAFMRARHPEGFFYLEPLEAMWALACPTIGADPERLVAGIQELRAMPGADWSIMALAGLPTDHALFSTIVSTMGPELRLGLGSSTSRLVVDLEGGVSAFLARRSTSLQRSLRRSQRRAEAAGIALVDASCEPGEQLFARIMDVEARGWKGREKVGITEGSMHHFYRLMMPRLCRRGAQRVLFARHEGRDVGYIFGGMRSGGYRGLQFSYDAEYRRYGLGNLLQLEQIRRLCEEGASTYDLGTHMEYKQRWADRELETVTLLLMRE